MQYQGIHLHMSENHIILPCISQTIALIFETFKGVTREGGVSWAESKVIDDYGSETEQLEARATDKDTCWEDLANDPDWEPFPGIGGFNFLDAIGFRYYLAATMVKELRGHEGAQG